MPAESYVRQQKAMEEWQQKAKSGNRKPCAATESHVAIKSHVLQLKTRKQIVATNSLLRQKKPCACGIGNRKP
jgi:hypothetical protein